METPYCVGIVYASGEQVLSEVRKIHIVDNRYRLEEITRTTTHPDGNVTWQYFDWYDKNGRLRGASYGTNPGFGEYNTELLEVVKRKVRDSWL